MSELQENEWQRLMTKEQWIDVLRVTPHDAVKVIVSAFVILFVTKIQLVSDKLSALLIALPLTSLIAMMWMQLEGQSSARIANHASSTFWFVLPTLPMFLVLPWLLRNGWGFWPALAVNAAMTCALFWALLAVMRRFGIDFY